MNPGPGARRGGGLERCRQDGKHHFTHRIHHVYGTCECQAATPKVHWLNNPKYSCRLFDMYKNQPQFYTNTCKNSFKGRKMTLGPQSHDPVHEPVGRVTARNPGRPQDSQAGTRSRASRPPPFTVRIPAGRRGHPGHPSIRTFLPSSESPAARLGLSGFLPTRKLRGFFR